MKILFQSPGYLPDVIGGLEVLANHLLQELQRRGNEILGVTNCIGEQSPGLYEYSNIKVQKLPFHRVLLSENLAEIARVQGQLADIVQHFQPDLIHLNSALPCSFFFLRRGRLTNVPRLLTLHSEIRPKSTSGLQTRLMKEASALVAVSQSVANDVVATVEELSAKLYVIRNALPVPSLQPSPIEMLPANFMCAGRLVRDKGVDVAVEAMSLLQSKGVNATLAIFGHGPERSNLENLVRARGLENVVKFRGWALPEDVYRMIKDATAVIVPSRYREPFGLIALQAALIGRPVVASKVGGLTEIVVQGDTGFLVPPDDPAALAAAMVGIIRPGGPAPAMGDRARKHATRTFDFSHFVDEYENIYARVTNPINRVIAQVFDHE